MRIVHVHTDMPAAAVQKPKAMTKTEKRRQSARRWMEIQDQRNYRAALKEFDAEIKAIQLIEPGWLPTKD